MEIERGRRNGSSYSTVSSSSSSSFSHSSLYASSSVLLEGVSTGKNGMEAAAVETTPLNNGKSGNIVHRVSKMDTLAGIAIKYGVEVADIKRMNGLVSDVQMFAHEKLQIPLPGRHLPSPIMLNGSSTSRELTPQNRCRHSVLESLQTLKWKTTTRPTSPAMSILQRYYGLTPSQKGLAEEGTELDIYKTSKTLNFEEELFPRASPISEPSRQKFRTLFNKSSPGVIDLLSSDPPVAASTDGNNNINSDQGEGDASSSENSVRRRQKTDADYITTGDNSFGKSGKGLALRGKSASRTDLVSFHHANPVIIGDSFMSDGFISVRKSSSTSNLQESDNSSSLLWPTTKRIPKPDAIIGRSIFDGLPKPPTSRRNKTALD